MIKNVRNVLDTINDLITRMAPYAFLISSHYIIMTHAHNRMFWPFMISSYLIAGIFFIYRKPKNDLYSKHTNVKDYLFSRDIWLHKSAINDYLLFLFNYIVYFQFIAYFVMHNPVYIQDSIMAALKYLNFPTHDQKPGIGIGILYTVFVLLCSELTYYIFHRMCHKYPFLWELHKVHHSAEVLTPLTFVRAHPIDIFCQNFIRLCTISACSGIFLYFYPNIDGIITVASIDAGFFIYYVIGANLHHSHIWMPYGKKLEHILLSPAQHQIHHSTNPKHFDKNYGSMLGIWDWAFNSLYLSTPEDEHISFGIGNEKEQQQYDSVPKLLWAPIRGMAHITYKKVNTLLRNTTQ